MEENLIIYFLSHILLKIFKVNIQYLEIIWILNKLKLMKIYILKIHE